MSEESDNCCGNCSKFLHEDASGWGWCDAFKMPSFCGIPECILYKSAKPSGEDHETTKISPN